jgi:predicted nucleotidyltransferase
MQAIDQAVEQQALGAVKGSALAIVLFGSHARRQTGPDSDIDVLAVVSEPSLPYKAGVAAVSPYTLEQLVKMARKGSLFILHLLREGIPLRDERRVFERVRASFRAPASYEHLRWDACAAARLLDVDESAYLHRWERYHALVGNLARTYAYSVLSDRGELVFDIGEAATRLGDNRLLAVHALTRNVRPDASAFRGAVEVVAEWCGTPPKNPYGSSEALIVNAYGQSELTVILGLRLLNESGSPLEYESLEDAVGEQCSDLR